MNSQTLLARIDKKHNQMCNLLQLADTMVSAASSMNSQNYEILMQTRQQFKEKLHEAVFEQTAKELPFEY